MPEPRNGRIGGGVLKDNLLRQGVNLNFANTSADITSNSPLIQLDVNNLRVGIKTDAPSQVLDIPNTIGSVGLQANYLNVSDFDIDNSQFQTTAGNINLSSNSSIFATAIATDNLKVDFNTISTTTPNTNIELRPDGTGTVNIRNNFNITGNLHATGNIETIGDITFGSDDQDDVIFEADVNSDIIPDQNNTSNLGRSGKKWLNIYSNLLNGQRVEVDTVIVGDTSLANRSGNIFYVAQNGDDANVGDHQHGPFRTLKHALSVSDASTAGPITIKIYPGVYEEEFPLVAPENVSIRGEDIRNTIIAPTLATNTNNAFELTQNTTIEDITIKDFYAPGYAFVFQNGTVISERSPYIRNITVITKGSVTSASDPRGFDEGDAGGGAYIDGGVLDSATLEASMLFHRATFITPGVDCITMTNGTRVEWLNSFTYFANRGLYATQGVNGLGSNGTRFGAELRSIGSACVYGNYGAEADGSDTLMYLVGHNMAYIGTGKNVDNDLSLIFQDQEVVEQNNGKIHYVTTDQEGAFRVGDAFFANFLDGTSSFDIASVNLDDVSALYIGENDNITYIDGQLIETGNIQIFGNTITTLVGSLVFSPDTDYLDLENNPGLIISRGSNLDRNNLEGEFRYNTTSNLFEGYSTGNLSFGGIYSSDRQTSIDAHPTNNTIVLNINNIEVGNFNNTGIKIHGLASDDILINNNSIISNTLNADLNIERGATNNQLIIDDLILRNSNIINTSNNPQILQDAAAGYIKFGGAKGMVVPSGTDFERPANPPDGMMRYNTSSNTLEVYDTISWQAATGEGGDVDEDVLNDLLDLYTLILG